MVNHEIYPLAMAVNKGGLSAGFMTYLMNYDKMVHPVSYTWYIKGPKKNIIVDTGCPLEIRRQTRSGIEEIMTFEDALKKVDLTPEKVDIVIQLHLDYSHAGNTSKCKNAVVVVQKKELEFALAPHPLWAHLYHREMFSRSRLYIVDGDTQIVEGIQVLLTPGHTPGSQSVAVQTANGTAIITGFCSTWDNFVMPKEVTGYVYKDLDELETRWPVRAPGLHVNSCEAFDSALRVKGLADILIPNHDPMWQNVEKIPS